MDQQGPGGACRLPSCCDSWAVVSSRWADPVGSRLFVALAPDEIGQELTVGLVTGCQTPPGQPVLITCCQSEGEDDWGRWHVDWPGSLCQGHPKVSRLSRLLWGPDIVDRLLALGNEAMEHCCSPAFDCLVAARAGGANVGQLSWLSSAGLLLACALPDSVGTKGAARTSRLCDGVTRTKGPAVASKPDCGGSPGGTDLGAVTRQDLSLLVAWLSAVSSAAGWS
eukprot:3111394-Rhodomonas_salina.1